MQEQSCFIITVGYFIAHLSHLFYFIKYKIIRKCFACLLPTLILGLFHLVATTLVSYIRPRNTTRQAAGTKRVVAPHGCVHHVPRVPIVSS